MLIISSDIRVCWQIIKRKPENFEKKQKIKTQEREQIVTSKNCICQQKLSCIFNIIAVLNFVRLHVQNHYIDK